MARNNTINKKKNSGTIISKCISVQETIIETMIIKTGYAEQQIRDTFEKSEVYKKLFDISTSYYDKDVMDITDEFMDECRDKYGWQVI